MRFTAALFVLLLTFAPAAVAQGRAAGEIHPLGSIALSPDGRHAALSVILTPASEVLLVDTQSHRAFIIEAPAAHTRIGDFNWSPDGDELTFVTGGDIFGGEARHVWRLRMVDGAPRIDLLALIDRVRLPALSADGARLATAERPCLNAIGGLCTDRVYALIERNVSGGEVTRRSDGHADVVWALMYGMDGALTVSLHHPQFDARVLYQTSNGQTGEHVIWSHDDAEGRSAFTWEHEIGGVWSFRIAPGETLPLRPTPFPAAGAPNEARAVRPTADGRVIVLAPLDPSNTRHENLLRHYYPGGAPQLEGHPRPWQYIAYDADGAAEIFPIPAPRAGEASSGRAISADGRFYVTVTDTFDRPSDGIGVSLHGRHALRLYDRAALAFETPVAQLRADAQRVPMELSDTPVMPAPP